MYQTQDDSTPCVQVKYGAEDKNVPETSHSVSGCTVNKLTGSQTSYCPNAGK